MRKLTLCLAAVLLVSIGALSLVAIARADEMTPPKPGPETMALDKFFAKGGTWTGQCPAGAMGADSKAMTTHGKAVCRKTLDGFWYVCEVEDMMGTGKEAMTWKGRMMVGYDLGTKSYKSVVVDNMGTLAMFNGTLDGNTFVLETPEQVMMMGQMMKDRLTWTLNPDGTIDFKDEHQTGEGQWMTFESATVKPMATSGKTKSAMATK
jgi:hypothetical protein